MKTIDFFFYSSEGNEPAHIHIEIDDTECKFWLDPIRLAAIYGVKAHQIREIERIIYKHVELFIEKYNEYHQYR